MNDERKDDGSGGQARGETEQPQGASAVQNSAPTSGRPDNDEQRSPVSEPGTHGRPADDEDDGHS